MNWAWRQCKADDRCHEGWVILSFSPVSTPKILTPPKLRKLLIQRTFSSLTIVPSKMCPHVMAAPEKEENRARNLAGFRMCLASSLSLTRSLLYSLKELLLPNTELFSHYCQQQNFLTKLSIFHFFFAFLLLPCCEKCWFRLFCEMNFSLDLAQSLPQHFSKLSVK